MYYFIHIISTILAISQCSFALKAAFGTQNDEEGTKSPPTAKLLILLLDGFRWDYYHLYKEHLPGFQKLIETGVQVEYVEPIFPSLSLPSWTTITTGLYPAYHNILGNFMLHRADNQRPEITFSYDDKSSNTNFWWKFAEPLWITATKAGQNVSLAKFSRCDVPYQGVLPAECTSYVYTHDENADLLLRKQLTHSLLRFQQGYTLVMIHYDSIDIAGHEFCPESDNFLSELIKLDTHLKEFLYNLKMQGLHETVNVVVTSDHGMTNVNLASGTKHVKLEDYINNTEDIYRVVRNGPMMMIAAAQGKIESLFHELSLMPGVSIYKKEDIPDKLHFKEGQHVLDILLFAHPKYFLVGLKGSKQFPFESSDNTKSCGSHGYYNSSDMRSIFYASGPGFKKGVIHKPIGLEDQYQIFTHILGLKPRPHNGTWENVKDMFETLDS